MTDKPNALNTLGLEIEADTLKGAELCLQKGQPVIKRLFSVKISKGDDNVNPLYIKDSATLSQKTLQNNLVVTPMPTNEVLIRPLEIKLKKEKDIDAVLAFQAEPLLPYPLENGIVDRISVAPTQEGTQLTVLAVRKDHLQQHLNMWHNLKVEPEVVSCVPAALAVFAAQFHPMEEPFFVVHLGLTATTCVLIYQKKLIAAASSPVGIQDLREAFAKDYAVDGPLFEKLDFEHLEASTAPALAALKESLRAEVTRAIYALSKQVKGKEIAEILVTGEGTALNQLASNLLNPLHKVLTAPEEDPNNRFSIEELQSYAVPIGCALSCLPKQVDQINFRQQEFAYPHPWKRFKKPLAIYLILCLLTAAALYLFGSSYANFQEDSLKSEYSNLLVMMNKPYNAFEKEVEKKYPPEIHLEEGQTLQLKDLSQEDLIVRLRMLEKEMQSTPDSFPLMPNTPRVSDVLAWLSQHKALIGQPGEGLEPIQIENFSYAMVKRPEQTKKQEKYQVKVELEFTSQTPKQAREFHDALIAPNDFLDPKGEVKWSTNRGKYRTSFYLKDRTAYPSS